MRAISLPPPYKGQMDAVPQVLVQSPFCTTMKNFNNLGGSVNARNGNAQFIHFTPASISNVFLLAVYAAATPLLFVATKVGANLVWYDITSGSESSVLSIAGSDTEMQTLFFNNYLYFFGDVTLLPSATGPQYYNGSAWGTAGYTWESGFKPFGGTVYKNRAYFIGKDTASFAYSEIDGISGPTNFTDYAGLVSSKAILYVIASLSLGENVTQDNVLAFIFNNGEVLIFNGSYPDSGTWSAVARFTIPKPLYYNSSIDAKGDVFILTETGVFSLRALFTNGYAEERRKGISAAIPNRYKQIIEGLREEDPNLLKYVRGVYDTRNDRLIISFPRDITTAGIIFQSSVLQLIYDFEQGAWYEYQQVGFGASAVIRNFVIHNGSPFFVASTTISSANKVVVLELEGRSDFVDGDGFIAGNTESITYTLTTAPIPTERFGIIKVAGVEAIISSDLNISVRLRVDLEGSLTSGSQATNVPDDDITKALYDVGVEGNIVQAVFFTSNSSLTPVVGYKLYGLNFLIDESRGAIR